MDDVSLDRLLSGDLNKLPKLPKRVVRLFISSTFTDMTLERNSLMERVYPRLKKYCRERHGLDFQVVDMRWGVRDEATDDHQTVNLCSREIENCQRVSLGPNFIALIGDKYGFRPLLNRIKSTEYRSLRRCLIESDINTDFLDTWYKEDLNAVPAEYVLQPISSILKNFTNKNEPELQMVDQRIWQAIQQRLHELLQIGSSRLVKQGRMSEREQALKYSISVTEREVIEGCLDLNETKSHCLVYVRSIVDLRDQLAQYFEGLTKLDEHTYQLEPNAANTTGDSGGGGSGASGSGTTSDGRRDSAQRKASLKIGDDSITLTTSGPQTAAERKLERQRRLMSKYIDLTSKEGGLWQVDEEAQEALTLLREVKLKSKLSPNGRNLTIYQVHWNNQDGISVKSEEHKRYLDELTGHFYQNLTRMIRNAVRSERSKVETRGLIGEVLQHSHYSLQVGKRLHGRSHELNQVRDYIITGSCQPLGQSDYLSNQMRSVARPGASKPVVLPMFLYGVSGSGKTSVLARVATLAHDWIKQSGARRRSSTASDQTFFGLAPSPTRQQDQPAARHRWDKTPCIIMRFCCTTPASSSVVGLLTSVCRQLQYNFYQFGPLNGLMDDHQLVGQGVQAKSKLAGASSGQPMQTSWPSTINKRRMAASVADQLPFQQIPEDFVRLVYTFRQLLENCRHSLHRRRTFVIILDSIERLSSQAECSVEAKFSWLTNLATLPPNVRLIVSCGSSGATRSELDDYLHLKRHFLRVHVSLAAEERPTSTDSASVTSESSDEQSSSSNGQAEPLPSKERPVLRFQLLRRLIIPATRLARGSRGLSFDGTNNIRLASPAQLKMPPVSLMGPTGTPSTIRSGGSDGDIASSLARFSSSESLHGDHRPSGGGGGRSQVASSSGLLHIKPLGRELGQAVLRRWLAESGRNLTHQQWAIVDRSLGHCSRPIFVKLAFGEVINWKSYSMRGDTRGLTFGSAWLGDFKLGSGGVSSRLEELVCRRDAMAKSNDDELKFKWQMLAMEQQWLNYLDYKSNKTSSNNNNQTGQRPTTGSGGQNDDGELVIRVGGDRSVDGTQSGSGRPSANGGSLETTLGPSSTSSFASSSSASICHLSDTIEDAICQLFARIELKHGYLLTKHSLSYITAARNGICENELEDILSLDDVVLDDVFQYHLPPVRRIPPLLWTRIRNDLPDYLSERDADGIVLTWHHGQFKAVTEKRYLASDRQLVYVHSLMADYFLGKWADKAKPFRCTKQQVQMAAEQLESAIQQSMRRDSDQGGPHGKRQSSLTGSNRGGGGIGGGSGRLGSGSAAARSGASFSLRNRLRSSDQHDKRLQWMQAKAHRRVPHQPLFYEDMSSSGGGSNTTEDKLDVPSLEDHQSIVDRSAEEKESGSRAPEPAKKRRYNLRKLTELPHHLLRSGRFLELASHVFFNYRWLFATIDALGLQSLFADLSEAINQLESELAERRNALLHLDDRGQPTRPEAEADETDGFNADELAVSTRDNLSTAAMKALSDQLSTLTSTLRLSASVVHSDPKQLAPQLIGRLLPPPALTSQENSDLSDQKLSVGSPDVQSETSLAFIEQLLEHCDREGSSDCALLPIGHCLQSADGLQLSSLEGHPFGVLSMCLASDQRHLLAASSKFLMWNISTGEVARDVDPKLNGAIIRRMVLSSSNKLALAYTSNNQILALEILTQQVVQFDLNYLLRQWAPATGSNCLDHCDHEEQIAGLRLIDERNARRFFVWLQSGRVIVLRLDELELEGNQQQPQQQQDQAQQAGSSSISLHYELDYAQLRARDGFNLDWDVLEVAIEQTGASSDLVLVLARCSHQKEVMHLTTINVEFTQTETTRDIRMWPCLEARLIALGPSLRQLVVASSSGDHILLRRRRATNWSRGKPLSCIEWNEMDSSKHLLAIELEAPPLLVDQDDEQASWRLEDTTGELYERLAEFEHELDGDCDEIQPLHLAFSDTGRNSLASSNRVGYESFERRAKFVKLYHSERVVVLQLDKPRVGKSRDTSSYKRHCLLLPRDIRNVSLEPNKSQLSSKIVLRHETESPEAEHLMIVVATRSLLVYHLEGQQLLKCIEAHASRITSLLPIQTLASKSPSSKDGPQRRRPLSSSALVTSSMDKTVKIWNLMNLNKEGQTISRLASTSGGRQFDSICLNSQRPLAACLSRGQLSLWDWPSSRLLVCYDSIEELGHNENQDQPPSIIETGAPAAESLSKISRAKFSKNGRYLALAGVNANAATISLLAVEGLMQVNGLRGASNNHTASSSRVTLKPWSCRTLEGYNSVLGLKFLSQDSRLLVIAKTNRTATTDTGQVRLEQSRGSSSVGASSNSTQIEDDSTSAIGSESKLYTRLRIYLLTVPEARSLYTIECLVPNIKHYLAGGGNKSRDRLLQSATSIGASGWATGATGSSSDDAGLMVAVTCDHQSLVVVGVKSESSSLLQTASSKETGSQPSDRSLDASRTLVLNVYTLRDGQLARTIDLSQLQVANLQQRPEAPTSRLGSARDHASKTSDSSRGLLVQIASNGGTKRSSQRPPPPGEQQPNRFVAIQAGQFHRLRTVRNRDRQSIVALMDDERGSSWLVDVSTRLLMAQSSSWNGQVSFDGRFGLSRMFANSETNAGSDDGSPLSPGGLKLLEMRHCRSVKSLLTLDQFNSLLTDARRPPGESQARHRTAASSVTGQDRMLCGFTRPNDAYVYFCEPRNRQLLLVRLRDSKLLANYRLQTTPSRIKCSGDGLALVVGLEDGTLLSLAIVDPLANETLARLAQYPSRRTRRGRNKDR